MKIIREKFLTQIIGADTKLLIQTKKFDDIIGIIGGIIPEASNKERDPDIYSYTAIPIEFNGNLMLMDDLLEFSDMSLKLYVTSIFNASVPFNLKKKLIYDNLVFYFYERMYNVSYGHIKHYASISSNRDKFLCPTLTIRYPMFVDSAIESLSDSLRYSLTINIDPNNIPKYAHQITEKTFNSYNMAFGGQVLYDFNGNKYTFPRVDIQDINDLCIKNIILKASYAQNKKKDICGDIKISILSDIILHLPTWKYFKSGILLLDNGSKNVFVECDNLIDHKTYQIYKKCPKLLLKLSAIERTGAESLIETGRQMVPPIQTGNTIHEDPGGTAFYNPDGLNQLRFPMHTLNTTDYTYGTAITLNDSITLSAPNHVAAQETESWI